MFQEVGPCVGRKRLTVGRPRGACIDGARVPLCSAAIVALVSWHDAEQNFERFRFSPLSPQSTTVDLHVRAGAEAQEEAHERVEV